jgi:hypothetical protein
MRKRRTEGDFLSFQRSALNAKDNAPALSVKTLERQQLHSNAGALERCKFVDIHAELMYERHQLLGTADD